MAKQNKIIETAKGKPFDFILFVTVLIMVSFGIVMVLSASSPTSLAESGKSYEYVKTQLFSAILGLGAMYIISKIDYRHYLKIYKLIYVVAFILLALVPIMGKEVNGAKRWLKIGVTFQPSEIAKIALIIFYAAVLTKNKDKLKFFGKGFILSYVYLLPMLFILLYFQQHLSASIVIILIISIMMLMAGCKLWHFLGVGTVAGVGGLGAIFYLAQFSDKIAVRLSRITSFLNPWADPKGSRMASNTRTICNWFRRFVWSWTSDRVSKNTYIFQNHIMTLFLLY